MHQHISVVHISKDKGYYKQGLRGHYNKKLSKHKTTGYKSFKFSFSHPYGAAHGTEYPKK